MHITIFGATGKTGKFVVREALRRGHVVTAFVRTPSKLEDLDNKVKVIQGDVEEYAKVQSAIQGADAVISTLGHVKGSKPSFQTEAIQHIIKAMHESGVRRLIDLTGAGVAAEGDNPKFMDNMMTKLLAIVSPARIQDGLTHSGLIKVSDLDWTIVRTPVQTNSESTEYKVGKVGDAGLSLMSPRGAIAKFMIDILEQGSYIRELPVVTG
jgi:putative NADH-flavin reductase